MKRPVRVVPLKALQCEETGPLQKVKTMAARGTLPHFSDSGVTSDKARHIHQDVYALLVECPYCDGENALPANGASHIQHGAGADSEIACKHCQCLFLLSESKNGVRCSSTQPPDVA